MGSWRDTQTGMWSLMRSIEFPVQQGLPPAAPGLLDGRVECEHCPPVRRAWFPPVEGRDRCWKCWQEQTGWVRGWERVR